MLHGVVLTVACPMRRWLRSRQVGASEAFEPSVQSVRATFHEHCPENEVENVFRKVGSSRFVGGAELILPVADKEQ